MDARPRRDLPEADRAAFEATALSSYELAIRDMTRLNQLFAILSEPAPLDVMVDRLLISLSEMFAADVAVLVQVDQSGGLRRLGSIGLPDGATADPVRSTPSHLDDAIRTRLPILVSSTSSDPATEKYLRDLGVDAAAWLPVLGSDAVLAVLLLGRCQPVPFSREDADLLMSMAHRIGLILARAQADERARQLEARLRQAEKSESLGRMAAAIAHHFNNKLTAVMGWLEIGIEYLKVDRDPSAELALALDSARQASTISTKMLAYLGTSFERREMADLVSICRRTVAELLLTLPPDARLQGILPERPLLAWVSESDIRQVLRDLIVNSAEALPAGGGEIVVRLTEVGAAEVEASPVASPDWAPLSERYALIEVRDSGRGMTPDQIGKAFDPFFTTKLPGRGLGLPMAGGIVRAHRGAIDVHSQLGHGATFRVYLPIAAAAVDPGDGED